MGFGLLANSLPQNLNIGYWLAWKCRWKDILISEKLLLHTKIRYESRSSIFVIDFLKAKGCKFEAYWDLGGYFPQFFCSRCQYCSINIIYLVFVRFKKVFLMHRLSNDV